MLQVLLNSLFLSCCKSHLCISFSCCFNLCQSLQICCMLYIKSRQARDARRKEEYLARKAAEREPQPMKPEPVEQPVNFLVAATGPKMVSPLLLPKIRPQAAPPTPTPMPSAIAKEE